MAKAKKTTTKKTTAKKTLTVEEMVTTMVEIVESIGDLKAGIQVKKRDIVKMIPVNRENIATLNGMTKEKLKDTYESLIELRSKSAS